MRKKLQKILTCAIIFAMIFSNAPSHLVRAGLPDTQVLNPSKLSPGAYTTTTSSNGFTIYATSTKAFDIDSSVQISSDYREFTQRIKLNGTGASSYRSIEFTTDGAATISVVALSGSNTANRTLGIYNASGEEVASVSAIATGNIVDVDRKVPVATATVATGGAYKIYSQNSGINVYYVSVANGEPESITYEDGVKPTIISATQDDSDGNLIDVTVEGTIPDTNTDMLWVKLYNESGSLVDSKVVKEVDALNQAVVQLSPKNNGNFTVVCEAARSGCTTTYSSDEYSINDFELPLGDVEISSISTTKDHELSVVWKQAASAESYNISYKEKDAGEYTVLATACTDTAYIIPAGILTIGEIYTIKVEAVCGSQSKFAEMNKRVSESEDRFVGGKIGSGAAGTVTENEDGSVTLDATGGKLADSEDGFLYYYTEINPETENFVLSADFYVDSSTTKDNQSGFGIMAVDTFEADNSAARYFNSAGSVIRKYTRLVNGVKESLYGAPGGYFVTGYTGLPTVSSSSRSNIDTLPFDWNWKSEYVTEANPNPPKFEDGEIYKLILKKDNTGFKASMIDNTTGEESDEIICYEPDLLLQQDSEKYYVGVAVARKIKVTVKNIQFVTSDPSTDAPGVARPKTEVTASFLLNSTKNTSDQTYDAAFKADYIGTIDVKNEAGNFVAKDIPIDPTNDDTFRVVANLNLVEGDNTFKAIYTPATDEVQGTLLTSSETLNQTPIEIEFTITYKKFGTSNNAIYVAPEGSAGNCGTKASPLDIYTAVAYAQPGQEIILTGGTYHLTNAITIERGNNGTSTDMITLMSDPEERATLDLTNANGGIILQGDYWHIYNLEICNARGTANPMSVNGNHNIIEKVTSHDNSNTGIQISGYSAEPFSLWPSYNLILSCEAYNNCDASANDADGFGAKLTCGEGNEFKYCISHHNIDDGWDLYAKSTTGAIGVVTIDQCVAYENGSLTPDTGNTAVGEGNGFKLGGESIPVAHVLKNSISYGNLANGVFSNSNPSVQIENTTSYLNGVSNLKLNTNASSTTWKVDSFISYKGIGENSYDFKNQVQADAITNYVDEDSVIAVTDAWFENLDTSVAPTIAEDGSIDMHGLLCLTDDATEGVGGVLRANPNPTVIEIGDEITATPAPTTPTSPTTPVTQTTPTPTVTPAPENETVVSKLEIKVISSENNKDENLVKVLDSTIKDTSDLEYCIIEENQTKTSNDQGVKVKVTSLFDVKAGDKVYVSVYNAKTQKLERMNKTTYTVDKEGCIEFTAYRDATFVITDKRPSGDNVVSRAAQSEVKKTAEVSKGKTVKLIPVINEEYKSKVTYKVSDSKIATISKNGVVYGKKKGTVTVTTYVTIGKVTEKFTTKVTVK